MALSSVGEGYCQSAVWKRSGAKMTQVVVRMATYRTVGNFRWCKISWKCVQILQKKFSWCLFLWNECVMFWPHPYQFMDTLHMQNKETTLNDAAKKQACATTALSSFCEEAFAITKVSVSGLPPWTRNWLNYWINLDFEASLTGSLVICIVAGWFFSTAAI